MLTNQLFSFSRKTPALHIAAVAAYFLMVVLPHELVGKWLAATLDDRLGRDKYNQLVLALALGALVSSLLFFWRNISPGIRGNRGTLTYLAVTIAAIVISFNMLVVVNIEAIHLVQYAVLAILILPLAGSHGLALGWATLLGAVDEAWQHFYLAPLKSNYYDFNDILLDLLGAALGLVLIKSPDVAGELQLERKKKAFSALLATMAAIFLVLAAALASGLLHYHPPAGAADLRWVILRVPHDTFWTTVHPNVTFHVMQPMEGLVIIAMLLLYYQGLDEPVNTARK